MNIYLVSQDYNNGYDTYDSMVVVATTAEDAKKMHPSKNETWLDEESSYFDTWVPPEKVQECVKVEKIGFADNCKQEVILASFNAG